LGILVLVLHLTINPVSAGATIAKWKPPSTVLANPNFNANWQKMTSLAWTVDRIYLDGVLFRGEIYEKFKNNKTNNTGVQCHVQVDNRSGRQRTARSHEEICYGVIQRFYLHFQWEPTRDQLKTARVSHRTNRIDPDKVPIPHMVVADCRWYRSAGEEQTSQLTVVEHWPDWDRDCPLSDVQNWFAMNIALWPARLTTAQAKNIKSNRAVDDDGGDDDDVLVTNWLKSHRVVITHHEAAPTLARRR
jgi:hypothetical protein